MPPAAGSSGWASLARAISAQLPPPQACSSFGLHLFLGTQGSRVTPCRWNAAAAVICGHSYRWILQGRATPSTHQQLLPGALRAMGTAAAAASHRLKSRY